MAYNVVVYVFNGVKLDEKLLIEYFMRFYRKEQEYILNVIGLDKCFYEHFGYQLLTTYKGDSVANHYLVVGKLHIVYASNIVTSEKPAMPYEFDMTSLPKIKLSEDFDALKIIEKIGMERYKIGGHVAISEQSN